MKTAEQVKRAVFQLEDSADGARAHGDIQALNTIGAVVSALQWVLDNDTSQFGEMIDSLEAVDKASASGRNN